MKNKKLNIIFLDFDDIKNPLLGAGQAKATLEVGKRLASKGHKVFVICSRYPKYKDRLENGIYYKHIGLGTKNVKVNNIVYILTLPFKVITLKGDVVIECFTAPISTLFSPLFTKIPVVALTTSFEADRFAKLYHLPVDRIEKFGLKFYKYFMPYTKYLDNKIKKVNKNALTKIIPEGVGEEFFKIKKKTPKHILFLGRLDISQKGIDLLLKAYSEIQTKIDYPLVIAGFGPDEEKIRIIINNLKLSDKVVMAGSTFDDKKEKLLAEALFVAFPSRNEGFSLFSLESLASGLPMVSFDIPSLAWAGEDTVLKAKPFNTHQYGQLLLKMTDKKLIYQMSKNARKIARKYTWNNVANNFELFFYEILEKEKNEN